MDLSLLGPKFDFAAVTCGRLSNLVLRSLACLLLSADCRIRHQPNLELDFAIKIQHFFHTSLLQLFRRAYLTTTFGGSVLSFLSFSPSLSILSRPCFRVGGLGGFWSRKKRQFQRVETRGLTGSLTLSCLIESVLLFMHGTTGIRL